MLPPQRDQQLKEINTPNQQQYIRTYCSPANNPINPLKSLIKREENFILARLIFMKNTSRLIYKKPNFKHFHTTIKKTIQKT